VRVLLISGSLPPMKCGIGDYTAQLAAALARRSGITVAVLSGTGAAAPADRAFEVLAVTHDWRLAEFTPIARAIQAWQPDVVHMQFPTQGYGRAKLPWLMPALLATHGFRVAQTWHEYVTQDSVPALKHSLLNLPNALWGEGLAVVRPNFLERMAPWYRALVRRKRFRFIPNAPSIPVIRWTDAEREAKRRTLAPGGERIVAYFGFAYAAKGIEQLFEIADPTRDRLILVCDLDASDSYQRGILERASAAEWAGRVTVTGFQSAEEAGRILAAADAAVFPFRAGGGEWNTTLQGAAAQGTFVLTTSDPAGGYDAARNAYLARIDDVADMRRALEQYAGRRGAAGAGPDAPTWDSIAAAHQELYEAMLERSPR
jgi:glycosyltransferase involved in cell wall biosynthesis